MARIDDMKAELAALRQTIADTEAAASVSVDGRSLTRQSLAELRSREAQLTWAISGFYRGTSLGRIEFQ